jgi:hypothetical protein
MINLASDDDCCDEYIASVAGDGNHRTLPRNDSFLQHKPLASQQL